MSRIFMSGPCFLPAPCHETFVAGHAEDTLACTCISQILNLPLAIAAPEARRTKGLVAS